MKMSNRSCRDPMVREMILLGQRGRKWQHLTNGKPLSRRATHDIYKSTRIGLGREYGEKAKGVEWNDRQ